MLKSILTDNEQVLSKLISIYNQSSNQIPFNYNSIFSIRDKRSQKPAAYHLFLSVSYNDLFMSTIYCVND